MLVMTDVLAFLALESEGSSYTPLLKLSGLVLSQSHSNTGSQDSAKNMTILVTAVDWLDKQMIF